MKMMTVGLMILVMCLGIERAFAQTYVEISTFVPLTNACDGGNPLPDGTPVCIFWDQDNDGPDETDPFPEGIIFSCFEMNGNEMIGIQGTFWTEPPFFFPADIPMPSAFYVRALIGGDENFCWASEVFTIHPVHNFIELDEWTCGPCPTNEVPEPVTGLQASQDLCHEVMVTWNPVEAATGYRIYINGMLVAAIQAASFSDNQLPPGTNCRSYEVQAHNGAGAGPISDPVQGCAVFEPDAVEELQASDDLCREVLVSWNAVPRTDFYYVLRNNDTIATVLDATFYSDLTAIPSVTYTYRVIAVNECGPGGIAWGTQGYASGVLLAPSATTASANVDDHVEIAWVDAVGESGYEILRSEFTHTPHYEVIGTTTADVVHFADYTAAPGQEYLYRVRGFDTVCGAGPLSVEARGRRSTVEPVIFGEVRVTNNLAGVMSAEAADLDDDGDVDVVGAGMFADKVAWYENDGQWNFTEHVLIECWQGARAVDVGDIDGDGDWDIAAVAHFENSLVWFERAANGFTVHPIAGAVNGASDVELANLNNAGPLEILTAAATDGEVSRWNYVSDDNFTRGEFAANMPGVRALTSRWYVAPGFLWVCGVAHDTGELAVWYRTGDSYVRITLATIPGITASVIGILASPSDSSTDVAFCADNGLFGLWDESGDSVMTISSIIASPRHVATGRIDNGLYEDLVLASGNEVTWWRNTSNRFYRNVVTDNLPQASFVSTLDADGDTDTDILAAGDNEIRLYLSTLRDLDNITQLVPAPEDEHDSKAFGLPTEYALEQNYPNPFNAQTTIRFALPAASTVRLAIYDLAGREAAQLVNGTLNAGTHSVSFDAAGLASGVYFYRIETENFVATHEMVLLK
ncbi:MAG: T9SS type A sorting domain-containing protein [bacterium]|nr:T9SS type A sorting domain-containing protein [bacterium]